MNKIPVEDEDIEKLMNILKLLLKRYNVDLNPGSKGFLKLTAFDNSYQFILDYFVSKNRANKFAFHLREKVSNTNIIRINIDDYSFHKNSDGEKINGPRLMIFSSEEWQNKSDGYTHTKAYPLPECFKPIGDIESVFLKFLGYINTKRENKLQLNTMLL